MIDNIDHAMNAYLGSLANRRWEPGVMDCGVFMADWVRIASGIDPIADVRGSYSSVEEFDRILDREGGFVKSCSLRMRRSGWVRTMTSEVGYVAIVMAPFMFGPEQGIVSRPTGAICVSTHLRAVMTSDMGVVIAGHDKLPLVRAFRHA